MENQHQKITGYRELTQGEIDTMNAIKMLAEGVGASIKVLEAEDGIDQRWVGIAKTQLQQGFMALTRAVAQPTTF